MPAPLSPEVLIARLEELLAWVRQRRAAYYPEGWTYDPLYMVEKELEALLQELA